MCETACFYGVFFFFLRDLSPPVEKVFTYLFQDELVGGAGGGGDGDEHNEIQARATFNSEIFFYVLLPPIIFHAGYGMHR